jgi:hypothetical protein
MNENKTASEEQDFRNAHPGPGGFHPASHHMLPCATHAFISFGSTCGRQAVAASQLCQRHLMLLSSCHAVLLYCASSHLTFLYELLGT